MLSDLPSPLLRSFVAVVDGGSLAQAARRVGRSESALSLQMSRLEDVVGQPLFERDGRALKLNQAGSVLLFHSRAILGRIDTARAELALPGAPPVRIGIVQDFVDLVLRPTLADVRAHAPSASVTIVIGSTVELLQALGEDRIDTAVCAGEAAGGAVVARLRMRWFGEPGLAIGDMIPLVGITLPCPFMAAAQQVLDLAGSPWRMTLATPSLDGLRAAVEAGLGITCRTEAGLTLQPLPDGLLPTLPDIAYSVVERRRGKDGLGFVAQRLTSHLTKLAKRV